MISQYFLNIRSTDKAMQKGTPLSKISPIVLGNSENITAKPNPRAMDVKTLKDPQCTPKSRTKTNGPKAEPRATHEKRTLSKIEEGMIRVIAIATIIITAIVTREMNNSLPGNRLLRPKS
jgi:hypothetical protein